MAASFRSPRPPYAAPAEAQAEPAPTDFAFADTVVAVDLDEPMPPSGVVISEPSGSSHCVVPVPASYRSPLSSRAPLALLEASLPPPAPPPRSAFGRMRAEMRELWRETATLEESHDANGTIVYHGDAFVRAATVGRRVRTLFSFFEWDRADVLRAAWIGLAVFVIVATVGAVMVERQSASPVLVRTSQR